MACPTVADLSRVEALLAAALKRYGHERLELEFRVGHRAGTSFVPGLPEDVWTMLKERLERSPAFAVQHTMTRELLSEGGDARYVMPRGEDPRPAHWLHKKRLHDVDTDTDTSWSCRTSISLEQVGRGPPPTSHRFQRDKERWSFRHKCWSVDMTRVVSNLPHQLDNDDVSFEVEVELRDTGELFGRPLPHVLEWGWTIVTDLCDMAGSAWT